MFSFWRQPIVLWILHIVRTRSIIFSDLLPWLLESFYRARSMFDWFSIYRSQTLECLRDKRRLE